MESIFLVITSIAKSDNPVLQKLAKEAADHQINFILIGDTKSPEDFFIEGCDFYSVKRQETLKFGLKSALPYKHYARKNLGYLQAISSGANIIIETDDDNIPYPEFWNKRVLENRAKLVEGNGWTNVYKYFTNLLIWPRGFSLEHINDELPVTKLVESVYSPIQQGLADDNPDVDAIYRFILQLPIKFDLQENIALGRNTWCPFNSQNTTWFKDAFPLLYLPSYCSFRMTDIWRSFIAQRICWENNWPIIFHNATVFQERNEHNLLNDFSEEIPGYLNNELITRTLTSLKLKPGVSNIPSNMIICYQALVHLNLIDEKELQLLDAWLEDLFLCYQQL